MVKGKNRNTEAPPRLYRILPSFNRDCRNCSLANSCALDGHSFGRIQNVELLVVAAYPAREEVKKGYSLAPNTRKPKIDKLNAGRYLQYSIISTFDHSEELPNELKPFYERVAFTNMIKCSPFNKTGDKITVTDKHIRNCKQTWLEKEIAEIAKYNPTCPIMLCGSEASKLLGKDTKVYSNRRKLFMYKTHPVIITFNPVEAVRYTAHEIHEKRVSSKGKLYVEGIRPEKPIITGSTTWHWKKDMESVRDLVIANYRYKENEYRGDFKDYVKQRAVGI